MTDATPYALHMAAAREVVRTDLAEARKTRPVDLVACGVLHEQSWCAGWQWEPLAGGQGVPLEYEAEETDERGTFWRVSSWHRGRPPGGEKVLAYRQDFADLPHFFLELDWTARAWEAAALVPWYVPDPRPSFENVVPVPEAWWRCFHYAGGRRVESIPPRSVGVPGWQSRAWLAGAHGHRLLVAHRVLTPEHVERIKSHASRP